MVMAQIAEKQPIEKNPFLQEVIDNLDVFIENLNCLHDTYGYSEGTLNQQKSNAEKKYKEFLDAHLQQVPEDPNAYEVPSQYFREFNKLIKRKSRAEQAFLLIPPTYIVSLVSIYDTFFAGLVKCVYKLCPQKLNESGKTFCYKDLQEFQYIKDIKDKIISGTIEDLLRDSHIAQITWLEKAYNVKTLKSFEGWPQFVELTERRNLFVHADGIVSSQYINVCQAHNALDKRIVEGNKLTSDKDYFESSYKLLYAMGIMLTQMLLHQLYLNEYGKNNTSELDEVLITNVFDLICDGTYDVAIKISKFALDEHFVHTGKDKSFIILNMAQSYKWNKDNEECLKILGNEDTTTWNNDLLIPKLTLEESYGEVYVKMRNNGKSSEVLTAQAYRDWPIFKELRKQPDFEIVFKEVFGENLYDSPIIKVVEEDTKKEVLTTES